MAAAGSRASQLFHTVVVVGAAMGCGTSRTMTESVGGGAPEAGEAGLVPADCSSPAQYQCDSSGHCRCDPSAPLGVCDCARPGEFRCRGCATASPFLGRCPNDDGISCFCNTSIAVASPTDCASPEQFSCTPAPLEVDDAGLGFSSGDWFDYGECACNTALPVTAADCASSCAMCSFQCTTGDCPPGTAAAALSSMRFDCRCVPAPVPIAQAR
jgi:hypothetical protein